MEALKSSEFLVSKLESLNDTSTSKVFLNSRIWEEHCTVQEEYQTLKIKEVFSSENIVTIHSVHDVTTRSLGSSITVVLPPLSDHRVIKPRRNTRTLSAIKSQIYYNIFICLHIFIFLNTDWKAIFSAVFQQAIS